MKMDDTTWIFERRTGAYSPAELDKTGQIVDVVTGFSMITSQEDIIKQGATRIIAVDDVYVGGNVKTVWEDGHSVKDNQDDM